MTLLPAVVDALEGSGIPVAGAGGFCDGKTLVAGGECAQRVNDLPKVQDLVDKIMQDAVNTIEKMPTVLQG